MAGVSSKSVTNFVNSQKFVTQQFDSDLSLDLYQFRYRNYDCNIGRFIEIDPLAHKYLGVTPFAYAENDVIRSIDLEGLEKYVVINSLSNSGDVLSTVIHTLNKAGELQNQHIKDTKTGIDYSSSDKIVINRNNSGDILSITPSSSGLNNRESNVIKRNPNKAKAGNTNIWDINLKDKNHELHGINNDPDRQSKVSINAEIYKLNSIVSKTDDFRNTDISGPISKTNTYKDVANGDLQLTQIMVYFQNQKQQNKALNNITVELQNMFGSNVNIVPVVDNNFVSSNLQKSNIRTNSNAIVVSLITSLIP